MDNLSGGDIVLWVVLIALAIFVIVTIYRAIRVVPQQVALIVERLGKYHSTFNAGLHILVPFIDKVRAKVDLREQVVSFPPQPVITSDNLVVSIDSVIYFQVTDPKAAVYEIAYYITGIEQLTVTTLRNVIGSMDLEQTLTSRDQINGQLRGVLDEATGRWGIRVNRVELKAIDPPPSVQETMEKQMRAERDRRATILTAEGIKQSAILTAEGEKQSAILTAEGQAQSAILRAEGDAKSAVLRAQGESKAILQVFEAIHRGDADPKLLAYQYLQMLPQISNSPSSKMWIIPTELTEALSAITRGFGGVPAPASDAGPSAASTWRPGTTMADTDIDVSLPDPAEALRQARSEVEQATRSATTAGTESGLPFDPEVTAGQEPDLPDDPPKHARPQ